MLILPLFAASCASDSVVVGAGDTVTLTNIELCTYTSNSTYSGSFIELSDAFTGPDFTVYIEPSVSARGITVSTQAASDGSSSFE